MSLLSFKALGSFGVNAILSEVIILVSKLYLFSLKLCHHLLQLNFHNLVDALNNLIGSFLLGDEIVVRYRCRVCYLIIVILMNWIGLAPVRLLFSLLIHVGEGAWRRVHHIHWLPCVACWPC